MNFAGAPRASFMQFFEWALFAALIAALVLLWWFVEFPPRASHEGPAGSAPEEVLSRLLSGSNTVRPIPTIALSALAAPEATSSAAAAATSSPSAKAPAAPPPEVLRYLSAK